MKRRVRALLFHGTGHPLSLEEVMLPELNEGEVLLRVEACGVCRTDWHLFAGELVAPELPLILGHQIVGRVEVAASKSDHYWVGARVGVPWLASSCGHCPFCWRGEENLCDEACFTGFHRWGGFADYCIARAAFCLPIPEGFTSPEAAPLLCGGAIGYRALRLCGDAQKVGLIGFGAAAHLVTQIARYRGRDLYAFTRAGDTVRQEAALRLGAHWSGSVENPPEALLDAIVIFAADGALLPQALSLVRKGGSVICAGIHMSNIPSFPYAALWGERSVKSVANLTRNDGAELLALAAAIPLRTAVTLYPLDRGEEALHDLERGAFCGAAVIVP